jgi:CheY-like chemotaxis protein
MISPTPLTIVVVDDTAASVKAPVLLLRRDGHTVLADEHQV